jgi:hypothetical protein
LFVLDSPENELYQTSWYIIGIYYTFHLSGIINLEFSVGIELSEKVEQYLTSNRMVGFLEVCK